MNAPSSPISELITRIYSLLPYGGPGESSTSFQYVGGPAGVRWVIPTDTDVASVLESWSPYKFVSRMAWHSIRLAHLGRATAWLPGMGSLTVTNLHAIDWRRVGWKHGAAPVPVIYIGTPGPRQKAVMHLVNPVSGECEAVLKVPLRAGARESIVHESDVLAVMEDEFFTSAPSLLFSDRSLGVATQQFLPGKPGSRRWLPEYEKLLRSLLLPDEHTTLAGQASSWQDHPLWDSLDKPQMAALSAALAEQSRTTLLPACWMHGDFAPWNIRRASGNAPMLIDWEIAQRAALPLQDAFHFFHMQQFLFHRGPRSFAAAMETTAERMGVARPLSRTLELAYLARSFFSSISWDEQARADFLFKSLALALQEGRRQVVSGSSNRLRLIASRPERQLEARAQMLSAVTAEFERDDLAYCVLSGYEKAAASTGSDVDIMFRPDEMGRVPSVLARAAETVGAKLVQAIRHETSACYFVLARPEGKHVTHLAIDAYGDYRRDGRTWLTAAPLLARRRRYRDFFRLSVADEFVYRLTKKVLKLSLPAEQLKHLLHLFARDSAECQDRLAQHWPFAVAGEIERALLRQDREWIVENLPSLNWSLWKSRPAIGLFDRWTAAFLERLRLLLRIVRPTGFFVTIIGSDRGLCSELADRLMCNLAPIFRRAEIVAPEPSLWRCSIRALRSRAARIRSTLVIEIDDDSSIGGLRHWFTGPDLELRLTSEAVAATVSPSSVVAFNIDEFPDELVRRATAVVLNRLERRIRRRLRVPGVAVPELSVVSSIVGTVAEFESVGSD